MVRVIKDHHKIPWYTMKKHYPEHYIKKSHQITRTVKCKKILKQRAKKEAPITRFVICELLPTGSLTVPKKVKRPLKKRDFLRLL